MELSNRQFNPSIRQFVISSILICIIFVPAVIAQRPPASIAPAAEWRQFRGTPSLAGVSAATLPATLKLLWTYEAGDPIDSSAAIVGGVVYVGAGNGDLLALDPNAEELKWAAEWVREQDSSQEFHAVVGKVVAYVQDTLR